MRILTRTIISVCLLLSAHAAAAMPLLENAKLVKTDKGIAIDLKFEGNISHKNLKVEYERNFAQIVLKDAGIKSAKVIPLNFNDLEKVFIYQYQPGVARLRIISKNEEQKIKGHINVWNLKTDVIRIFIKKYTTDNYLKTNKDSKSSDVETVAAHSKVEQDLLDKVISGPEIVVSDVASTKIKDDGPIGVKTEPSSHLSRMIISLLAVISIFVGGAFVFKNYADRIDIKKLPFGKKERLIQVVAMHRLGKLQAITLVKITNEYMVMGVSGDNISLIAKLGRDVDVERYIEDRYWGGAFEKHLSSMGSKTKPTSLSAIEDDVSVQNETLKNSEPKFNYDGASDLSSLSIEKSNTKTDLPYSGVRESIRSKLHQFKTLG